MLTEQDLLLEIIKLSPEGAIWAISNDSWEGIPRAFGKEIAKLTKLDWVVFITSSNKSLLMQLIENYTLSEKIVHMSIKSKEGIVFFKCSDHMDTILMDFSQDEFQFFRRKYTELELISKDLSIEE
jgi:hypothetical protein